MAWPWELWLWITARNGYIIACVHLQNINSTDKWSWNEHLNLARCSRLRSGTDFAERICLNACSLSYRSFFQIGTAILKLPGPDMSYNKGIESRCWLRGFSRAQCRSMYSCKPQNGSLYTPLLLNFNLAFCNRNTLEIVACLSSCSLLNAIIADWVVIKNQLQKDSSVVLWMDDPCFKSKMNTPYWMLFPFRFIGPHQTVLCD